MSLNQKLKIRINQIIGETFNLKESHINPDHSPDDIENWDSLGQLKLINNIESEFNIVFTMEEIFQIMTIADIYDIMDKKIK